MSDLSWRQLLQEARQRPGTILGHPTMNHLRNGVAAPIRFCLEKRAFQNCESIRFDLSPTRYRLQLKSEGLIEPLDQLVDWYGANVLIESIMGVQQDINRIEQLWTKPFRGSINHFAACFANLILASQGAMAIRNKDGIWVQSFCRGWPKEPPKIVENVLDNMGLVIYAALEPKWFPELPFSITDAEAAISNAFLPAVTLNWHDDSFFSEDKPEDQLSVI